jgi:hypothetical protein
MFSDANIISRAVDPYQDPGSMTLWIRNLNPKAKKCWKKYFLNNFLIFKLKCKKYYKTPALLYLTFNFDIETWKNNL